MSRGRQKDFVDRQDRRNAEHKRKSEQNPLLTSETRCMSCRGRFCVSHKLGGKVSKYLSRKSARKMVKHDSHATIITEKLNFFYANFQKNTKKVKIFVKNGVLRRKKLT
jgi:hypothetical protein